MIPIDDNQDLADTLKLLRLLAGMTQTSVGEALGTAASRVGEYESGRRIANPDTLIRHLRAIGYRLAVIPLESRLDSEQSGVQESDIAETRRDKRGERA
jgi:transcriptional regulator with XRE-family HTH domain